MHLTRKHISRRTVLRGVGATMALPFLDAMIPARSVFAKTAAARVAEPRAPGLHRAGARGGGLQRVRARPEPLESGGDRTPLRHQQGDAELARAVPRLPDDCQQHRRADG